MKTIVFSVLILFFAQYALSQELVSSSVIRSDEFLDKPFALHRENGKMAGLIVIENKLNETWRSMGFQGGDLVVRINGNDLSNIKAYRPAIDGLMTASKIVFLVRRPKGNIVTYEVDIKKHDK